MKFLFALLAVAYAAVDYESEFKGFLERFGKTYEGDEVEYRFGVFKQNYAKIEAHNAGNHSWTEGVNQFSDLTEVEFKKMMLGYIPRNKVAAKVGEFVRDINWIDQGYVTSVKDQGQCGSCWAFSTTGGLEGAYKKSQGKLQSMAEQALVDCSGSYGNQGCNGGLMDNAFKYIKDKGIPVESDYPYTAKDGSCKSYTSFTKLSTYTDTSNLESDIQKQPISVAVDASSWSSYRGGIFKCSGSSLDHGVTLVGSGSGYWLVKNSWGGSWGEKGTIRVSKSSGSDCGITKAASYPTV